jgi:hypothetical protein
MIIIENIVFPLEKIFHLPDKNPLFLFFIQVSIAIGLDGYLLFIEFDELMNKYVIIYEGGNLLDMNKNIIKIEIDKKLVELLQKLMKIVFDKGAQSEDDDLGLMDGNTYYFYEGIEKRYGELHEPKGNTKMGKLIKICNSIINAIALNKVLPIEDIEYKINILIKDLETR